MRREVEQTVLQPIANQLARATNTTPTIVSLDVSGKNVFADVQPLEDAKRVTGTIDDVDLTDVPAVIDAAKRFLSRATDICQERRPQSELTAGSIDADYYHYLNVTELIRALKTTCVQLEARKPESEPNYGDTLVTRARVGRVAVWRSRTRLDHSVRPILSEFASVDNITEFMDDLGRTDRIDPDAEVPRLVRNLALLNYLLPAEDDWHEQRVLVFLRPLQSATSGLQLRRWREAVWSKEIIGPKNDWSLGIDAEYFDLHELLFAAMTEKPDRVLTDEVLTRLRSHNCMWSMFEGARARSFMESEQGTHLQIHGTKITPYQLVAVPMTADDDPNDVVTRVLDEHDAVFDSAGALSNPANPFVIRPVVRMYYGKTTIDLRSGKASEHDIQPLMFSVLPLPDELLSLPPAETPAATE